MGRRVVRGVEEVLRAVPVRPGERADDQPEVGVEDGRDMVAVRTLDAQPLMVRP
jgi:hypothetical protein